MIEHTYRGYVVERRGHMCRIPSLGAVVANEVQAHRAIDAALTPMLRVGDTVMWRGGFGADSPRPAEVRRIELIDGHPDDGQPVDEVPWSEVRGRCVVVDLSTGQWAYGYQIERLTAEVQAA